MSDRLSQTVASYRRQLEPEVLASLAVAAAEVPAFAARLAQAGLQAESVRSLDQLAELPVLSKDDLIAAQQADPPFGGLITPDAPIERIFQSPARCTNLNWPAPTHGGGVPR